MFVVGEADAVAIQAVFHQQGELSAAVELRRLFRGLDARIARECMRAIVGWERVASETCHAKRHYNPEPRWGTSSPGCGGAA
jgi:hypothetical protein